MHHYMSRWLILYSLFALSGAGLIEAHPMGNFSVSHYTRLEARPAGLAVTYVLDLAEYPMFELLQKWELKQDSPRAALEAKAQAEASRWAKELKFRLNGKPVTAKLVDAQLTTAAGAGNLLIGRIVSHLEVAGAGGDQVLEYEDTNYSERAGWKEIVVGAAKGTMLVEASHIDQERSKALTDYPSDPAVAPPQELRARLSWKTVPAVATQAPPSIVPLVQPAAVAPTPEKTSTEVGGPPVPAAPGEVVKGDPLSQLLSKKELSWSTVLVGLALAFWFGCLHATTPGHGKTMVAAYLVGERGTARHAVFLGAMVTFTHTVSVFILGIATYFLAGSFAPEKVSKVLGVVSGLSIVLVGLWLVYKRSMRLMAPAAAAAKKEHKHSHGHSQSHDHHHHHEHAAVAVATAQPALKVVHRHGHGHDHDHHHHGHDHDHYHRHDHDHGHHHHHGPGGHSHVPEGPVSIGSLIALGASGGLVPCPSALVLLLSSIAIGRIGFGLALLVSFSLGLAGVLMAIGLVVLYAKNLLPKTEKTIRHPIVKLVPVFSALAVTVIGVVMTFAALGWVRLGSV